jgi:tetratricopeptide (TPR) repeat protein
MKRLPLISLIVIFLLAIGQGACSRKKAVNTNTNAAAEGSHTADENRTQARALLLDGQDLYLTDQDEKAVEVFQEAVKLDPDLAEGYFRLGLAYVAIGKDQEAEDAYKKAVEKYKKYLAQDGKEDAEAHYNAGQAYAGLHLYSEAVREYRQATHLKDDDADMFYDLGTALTKLAQYDEAASAFTKSLEIDPENTRAEDALEEAREGIQRIKSGKKHQEDLLKKEKQDELKNANANGDAPQTNTSAKSNSNSKSNSNRPRKP